MESQQCNVTFKEYIRPGIIIGVVLSIVILLIISCIKKCFHRTIKWSEGYSATIPEKWKRIEELSKNDDTRPLSIIYACSLLDYVLTTKGYAGDSLSERLNSAQTAIGNSPIRKILRLRNELAHDAEMKSLDKVKTQNNLKIIRQVLFDLNVSV